MARITKLTINGSTHEIGAKASNVKLNSGTTVEAEIAKLNAMHDNHFMGIFVGSTTDRAILEAKAYYAQQLTGKPTVWFLAGSDLSELYAYTYDGTNEPVKISNNKYDFTDYESLKNQVATLQTQVNNIPIFSADNVDVISEGTTGLNVRVNGTHVFYIPLVDDTDPGLMSVSDKQKLDGLKNPSDAVYQVVPSTSYADVYVDDTNKFRIPSATNDGEAGLMSTEDKKKLDGLKNTAVMTEDQYQELDRQGKVLADTIYFRTED